MVDKLKGYIIIWRSIFDSPLWTNPKLQRAYFWVFLKANYKEVEVFPTTEKIMLKPGQFITSYPHASIELEMSVGSVKTYLNLLKTEKIIEINSTNKYTVITVQDWDELQNPERKNENKVNTERTQNETDNTLNTSNTKAQNPDSLSQDEKRNPEEVLWEFAEEASREKLKRERSGIYG